MQGDGVLEKFWPRMVPSCFPQASNQNGKNHFHSGGKFLSLKEMLNNYLLNEYSMCCLYIHCIEISVGLGICAIYINGSPGPEFTSSTAGRAEGTNRRQWGTSGNTKQGIQVPIVFWGMRERVRL